MPAGGHETIQMCAFLNRMIHTESMMITTGIKQFFDIYKGQPSKVQKTSPRL